MFEKLLELLAIFFQRLLRPKVYPGMWYFEAIVNNAPYNYYEVVVLNQDTCDEINNSSDRSEAWLNIIIRTSSDQVWTILHRHFKTDCRPQWIKIHPVNKDAILREAKRGKSIRALKQLDEDLVESLA